MTDIIADLTQLLGPERVLKGSALQERHSLYCANAYAGFVLVTPENSVQIAEIMRIAQTYSRPVVLHGGGTGLVDGTASRPGDVIVSTERLTRVERIDPAQGIASVEAGVTLAELDRALADYGLMVPVDIAARGSCTLGGMAATNAGGARALRYGTMRDNILGMEVVLADGTIVDLTNTLVKNNTGLNLRDLFIGSEGTLGLISRLVLRVVPRPVATATALVACADAQVLTNLIASAKAALSRQLLCFEALWPEYYSFTTAQPGFGARPVAEGYGVYALIEIEGEDSSDAQARLMAWLETEMGTGRIEDGTVAQSLSEREAIWRAREDSDAIETGFAANLSYDIGLEANDMAQFVEAYQATMRAHYPNISTFIFGHVGDGNLHVMLGLSGSDLSLRTRLDEVIYGTLSLFPHSTISAEHGIGHEKKSHLSRSKPAEAIALMRQIKFALDPHGLLNPGKMLP